MNNVPNNYARAKVAIFQPSKVHASKYLNMPYDSPLPKEFITTFVTGVTIQVRYSKNKFLRENDISNRENHFPIECLEFSTKKKNPTYKHLNSNQI